MPSSVPDFRLATRADVDALSVLMKASIRTHFPAFYGDERTEIGARYIGQPDLMLIDDGTYFMAEDEQGPTACGGWSRRFKLYTGSGDRPDDARLLDPETEPAPIRAMFVRGDRARRGLGTRIIELCEDAARAEGFTKLALMATLPGVRLYAAYGFEALSEHDIPMPDGTLLEGVRMEKPII
jgi:GNAT superfamily N-acetyltransferase